MRSIRFNATTSDVNLGVHAAQTPTAQTILALIYPIGAAENSQGSILMRTSGGINNPVFYVEHNAGAPRLRFTTDSDGGVESVLVFSADNAITYGAWQHVAMNWDGGVAFANIHFFVGLRGAPLAETAYGFRTNGTGSALYGEANQLHIGNKTDGQSTLNGDIAYVAQWNRVLDLNELRKVQFQGPLAVRGGLILCWDGERDLGPYALKPVSLVALGVGATVPRKFDFTLKPVLRRAATQTRTATLSQTLGGMSASSSAANTVAAASAVTLDNVPLTSGGAANVAASLSRTLAPASLSGILAGLFDAASNSGYRTAQSVYSWNHTCTGDNRVLYVGVSMLSVAGSSVSGITYNGVALELVRARASAVGAVRAELWRLVNPAAGSGTIEVTLSAALDSIGNAVSVCNASQTVPNEGTSDASATNVGAADATVSVVTVTDLDLVLDVVAASDASITVGAAQSQRGNVSGALGSGAMSTEGPKTPVGSATMSWTDVGAAATWSIVSTAVRPNVSTVVVDLSQSLGALASSATASVAIVGAAGQTLGAVTLAADADLALAASLGQTLGAATVAGSAQLVVESNLSQTLGAATLSATGAVAADADLVLTLGALTLASLEALAVRADLSQTLGALSLTAQASSAQGIAAALVVTLGDAALSAAGQLGLVAQAAAELGALELAAQATAQPEVPAVVATPARGVLIKKKRRRKGFLGVVEEERVRPLPIAARAAIQLAPLELVARARLGHIRAVVALQM